MHALQVNDQQLVGEDYRLSTSMTHMAAVERVIHTMRTQLHENLSLEDMADIACLSPYYFSRVFHDLIGIPPGEFLATIRIDAAKRLLLTTSLSVTDICFEVGYVGLGSFTTRFTQLVGFSPRHLRHLAKHTAMASLTSSNSLLFRRSTDCIPPPIWSSETNNLTSEVVHKGGVAGYIRTLAPFNGVIFVGLFPKPIPQGRPTRCVLLSTPGPYYFNDIPDGRYYLLVAALPLSEDPQSYLLFDEKLLVGIQGPLLICHGGAMQSADVLLRPVRLTDPPIIVALPFLSNNSSVKSKEK